VDNTERQHIINNLADVRRRIADACIRSGRRLSAVRLIAVAKNFPAPAVRAAIESGAADLGENRVQEALAKYPLLADLRAGFRLHFIGHLQSNKVKEALKLFDIIHSVDSVRLAEKLNAGAQSRLPVFMEVNLTGEQTKYGFKAEELDEAVKGIMALPNLEVLGLMTIAPLVSNSEEVRLVFRSLRQLNERFDFKELSMGMTDDFEVAVEEGATMLRIGRAIFGERS